MMILEVIWTIVQRRHSSLHWQWWPSVQLERNEDKVLVWGRGAWKIGASQVVCCVPKSPPREKVSRQTDRPGFMLRASLSRGHQCDLTSRPLGQFSHQEVTFCYSYYFQNLSFLSVTTHFCIQSFTWISGGRLKIFQKTQHPSSTLTRSKPYLLASPQCHLPSPPLFLTETHAQERWGKTLGFTAQADSTNSKER